MALNLHERIARMGPMARDLNIVLTITVALFVLGFWAGFISATIDHGHLPRKPLGWAVIAAGIIVTVAIVQLLRALFKVGMFAGMNRFDQRYWKMWLLVGLLSMPIGIGLALAGEFDLGARNLGNLFSGAPIEPVISVAIAVVLLLLMGAAMWLYHRAIDDHEERAYLWGSQIAYYFIALAMPAWWLLSRGGIVPPLDFAVAISLILTSFVVQAAVWAWLKFR